MKALLLCLVLIPFLTGCSNSSSYTTRGPDDNYTLDDNQPRDGTKIYGRMAASERTDYGAWR